MVLNATRVMIHFAARRFDKFARVTREKMGHRPEGYAHLVCEIQGGGRATELGKCKTKERSRESGI